MQIVPQKKTLILKLRDPERVTTVIPKAKEFLYKDVRYVAVKHGPEEVQILRNIGIDAPSPILQYYEWPGRFTPFDHQRDTADFLTSNNRAYNLNDLGTGKTLSTLWAYDYLRSLGVVHKALVVSPLSTLERVWADEVFQHFPHLVATVLHGAREKRLKLLATDADIYLINHDGIKVRGFLEAMKERPDIDLIIIDEISQAARTAGTDRYKALVHLANRQSPRKVWGLTGTPTPNQPTDAWAQCRIVTPDTVSPFFSRFRDVVMRQAGPYKWVPRENALQVVQQAMTPAIRYNRDECIDLPPCMYETRHVDLTPAQAKGYKEMMNTLKTEADEGQVLAVNEAIKAQKLIQIACIEYNTHVLTCKGWIPIQNVTAAHRVWDGVEWVSQEGAVIKGVREVSPCFGVGMTSDHLVLTTQGWKPAAEVTSGKSSKRLDRAEVRLPDYGRSRSGIWVDANHYPAETPTGEYRSDAPHSAKVYDLVNCGPRNRFVVRGTDGPLIVHNCGIAYGADRSEIVFDATPRLELVKEIVEEAGTKVIVFVPFVSVIPYVAEFLTKQGFSVESIYGEVPTSERNRIFGAFQREEHPRVLVAQPATMSHGLTLTAASTIIWYAATTSNDIFTQSNGRITRPGQKHSQLIIMIEGSDIERRYYKRLQEKGNTQGLLLDMFQADRVAA